MITVVLDDDPTGTQAVSDVSVILDWSEDDVWEAIRPGDRAVHVLTNSRAYDGQTAGELVRSATATARARLPGCRFVLRGDSTLRGHLWDEYDALRQALMPGDEAVPLLLVPALPAAGRVTVDGVHLLRREGLEVPLHETEYARDGVFAYSSARLARWAEERTAGRLRADDALSVDLALLRSPEGASSLAAALEGARSSGRPAAVIPDAETQRDLEIIADAVELAEARGTSMVIRCAPAFIVALTSRAAATPAAVPSDVGGVLVICGSFVPTSTTQVAKLAADRPGAMVETSVRALASDDWELEVRRVAAAAAARLRAGRLAVVFTERERDPGLVDVGSQRRIAHALAAVAGRARAGVVIAKGGITSAVTARAGLGARVARVLGPVAPGVALWKLPDGTNYLVVPGNVGGPGLLLDLVNSIKG